MMFDRLADGVTKHAKLIVIVWVLLLIASVYPMMHASESLSYEVSSMGGNSTESVDGALIMSENFSSMVETDNLPVVLLTYDYSDESTKAEKLANATKVANRVQDALINDYDGKISTAMVSGTDPDKANGLITIAVMYKSSMDSDAIADDTGSLRKFVDKQIELEGVAGTEVSGIDKYVTGSPAISYDASEAMSRDLSLVEPISIFLILFLVGLFFRSFVSAMAPPITIGVAYALVMCALFFLGQVLDIFYIVQMLLLTSMLGAGCDYCIFILSRYREERRRGLEHIEASREAIKWAGESVFTSGLAVMIGFGAMMICDFQLISTLGLGLAIGIVFALFAALTLMSSLVVLLGDKLFWPSGASGPKHEKGYLKFMGNVAHKYFDISTHFSIKHAKAVVIATVLFSIPMAYVYVESDSSYDMIGAMMTGESQSGMQVMTEYGDGGSAMPNYAVLETSQPIATLEYLPGGYAGFLSWGDSTYIASVKAADAGLQDAVKNVDDNIASVEGLNVDMTWALISSMFPADTPLLTALEALKTAQPAMAVLVDALISGLTDNPKTMDNIAAYVKLVHHEDMEWTVSDKYVTMFMDYAIFIMTGQLGFKNSESGSTADVIYYKLTMSTKEQSMADASIKTVGKFTDAVHDYVDGNAAYNAVWVSGAAAVMVEISEEMNTQFLKIELTAIILIILLLFFVLKSYLTPIRSVVTIFMSVIWTVAITNLLFDDVMGEGVLWMLPIILLVICLGLGMDYDILLTTRIREYRFAKGMDNDESIHQAVLHSGSVITICGVIMAGTFGTLMLSSTVMLQQMGFALFFAILVDALIVRTYIVPAAMHILGDWNWKGPRFLLKHDHHHFEAADAAMQAELDEISSELSTSGDKPKE